MRTHRNSKTEIPEQKTTCNGCKSPTARVTLKLGLVSVRLVTLGLVNVTLKLGLPVMTH